MISRDVPMDVEDQLTITFDDMFSATPRDDKDNDYDYDSTMDVDDTWDELDTTDDMNDSSLSVRPIGAFRSSQSPSVPRLIGSSASNLINHYPSVESTTPWKTFKLLYIPDLSRINTTCSDVPHNLEWVKRNLMNSQIESIKGSKGFYMKVKWPIKNNLALNGTTYWLIEWVRQLFVVPGVYYRLTPLPQ